MLRRGLCSAKVWLSVHGEGGSGNLDKPETETGKQGKDDIQSRPSENVFLIKIEKRRRG